MGAVRFGVPRELVLWLRDTFKAGAFVETGTNQAETAVWASEHFERVFTIEAYEPLYHRAVNAFGDRKNIQFLIGDSRSRIKELLPRLASPAIFWLDAHWCGEHTFGKSEECPIVGELELLNTSKLPHVVLIDDARLFLAPPPLPHEASHWPDMVTICQILSSGDQQRYVVVHEDVIIGVPDVAKPELVEFLRREAPKSTLQPSSTVRLTPLNWRRSIMGRRSNKP
jgi:hypothetical protein